MATSADRLKQLARQDPAAFEAAVREYRQSAWTPHAGGQREILNSEARFRVVAAGRRYGKTEVAAHEILRHATKPNQMIWWIASSYKNTRRGYKKVVQQLPPSLLAKPAPAYTSNELILQFKNDTVIEFYSGGNPDALAGEGVDFVVVDEAALIPDAVWHQLIRPTLMDTGGHALIISTPRGRNWFWEMWKRGQEGRPGYKSWRRPQTDNPYIPMSETDVAREELPDILFRQEIMAEFLASGASIFGEGINTEGVVVDSVVDPIGNIFMGIDLAKKEDFNVISASREIDRLPVYHEKFNDLSWPIQEDRIVNAYNQLLAEPRVESVTALVDSTGIGDVVFDHLTEKGMDCIPIVFNNAWKEAAAKLLAADMEKGKAHVLSESLPEFESYELFLTPSGKMVFEASVGHDDEVSAKMLEHWGMVHEGQPDIMVINALTPADIVQEEPKIEEIEPDPVLEIMERPGVWH